MSTFKRAANFDNSTYRDRVDFGLCRFLAGSNFHNSVYQAEFQIRKSTFQLGANLGHSRYKGPTDFSDCCFEKRADFQAAEFEQKTLFHAAVFKTGALFAAVYLFIGLFNPTSIEIDGRVKSMAELSLFECIYLSTQALSNVILGDWIPVSSNPLVKSLMTVEAVIGILLITFLVGAYARKLLR